MFAAGKTNSVSGQTYVDDVFSTYLYTGNGSTQTITNGIDLAGQGGLVWTKQRSGAISHHLTDTARGAQKALFSNLTDASSNDNTGLTSFSSTGYSIGSSTGWNGNTSTYASWTFRKAPKFFDVVTYTGNGSNRTIAHSLGQVPGMIVVKRTDTTGAWEVYHRSLANTEYAVLNTTAAKATDATMWNSTTPTASVFSLGTNTNVNASGGTYVAYLFAHDTATDGLIQCGSYTGNGSTTGLTVTLGWEPQFLLIKNASASTSCNWTMIDVMRGMPVGGVARDLQANTSNAEPQFSPGIDIAPTGFSVKDSAAGVNGNGNTIIYIAIRRPNKPPTTGTQVFDVQTASVASEGNQMNPATFSMTPDLFVTLARQLSTGSPLGAFWMDRLRGNPEAILSASTAAARTTPASGAGALSTYVKFDAMSTYNLAPTNTAGNNSNAAWAFRRAPGVFDVVCYTGTGSATTVAHNLGAVPELIISKERSTSSTAWRVYSVSLGANSYLTLNTTDASAAASGIWPSVSSTTFGLGAYDNNRVSQTYVAYLFATKAGISKVFSYTGNGSSQTINCGFAAGARFVLIKRTDSTGDWYVWDSTRGIVAGNDPHLSLNTTAAEVTTDDSVDADSTGFIVNQLAATNINVTSATYIGIAIA